VSLLYYSCPSRRPVDDYKTYRPIVVRILTQLTMRNTVPDPCPLSLPHFSNVHLFSVLSESSEIPELLAEEV
jgi:hypothetical protein